MSNRGAVSWDKQYINIQGKRADPRDRTYENEVYLMIGTEK